MELGGLAGMEGLVGASSEGGGAGAEGGLLPSSLASSGTEQRGQKGSIFANAFFKHGRSDGPEEHDWRSLKVARNTDAAMLAATAAPSLLRSKSIFPYGEQMLSFSSPKPDALLLSSDGTSPFYHHLSPSSSAAACIRSAGMSSASSNVNMHGILAGVRGPFTPSQWMELEHQALIYKYIDANAPIPSNLLGPIRRSLCQSGYHAFSSGPYRANSLAWGSCHLGFSGNTDPEPGRCRRTDGKKWRCSRDAVADGKYCERHMNRGRHRSRKHVEGQNGHAAKAVMPTIAPSLSASAVTSGGSSNSLNIVHHHAKSLQTTATDPFPPQFNRILVSKENVSGDALDSVGFSLLAANPKPIDNLFPIAKQHNPFEEASSRATYGLVSSDSLLNPTRKSCSENISFVTSPELNDHQSQTHPLRHFFDDWPKKCADRSTITWPEVEEMQSDRTLLSTSIPMASSDFSSSSSSPNQKKVTLLPLKLSQSLDPIPMGLGVGALNQANQRQASWIPISWESSMGGPLGEVLTNTNNSSPKDCSKNFSSSLNLLTDGWDSSPHIMSSPTGVLQKTGFGSLSSSTGSSPRAESQKAHDSTNNLCDDMLGPTIMNASAISSL